MQIIKLISIAITLKIFIPYTISAQNIYTVNNQKDLAANFSNLQNAIDNVPAGSILYLQPSSTPYAGVSVRKKITIYGNGYFLGQNKAPNTQSNTITSSIYFINFKPGSEGSLVSGIHFKRDGINNGSLFFDTTSNIIIERSLFEARQVHINFLQSSNIAIKQNFFLGPNNLESNPYLFYNNGTSACTFSNNIILGGEFARYSGDYTNFLFDHNTIVTQGTNFNIQNIRFINNILFKKSTTNSDTTINLISGNPASSSVQNISNYSFFEPTSNKQVSKTYVIDSIFISRSNNMNISSDDGIYKTRSSSIAIGYSTDGTECGAYGGINSYILSGIPPIPNIYFLNVIRDATKQGGLRVSIKVSSNN